MRVTRLAGPPGAGKSAVAWALAEAAAASGEAVAHVDIDQLGICYPARPDDPERCVLKERALAAVADVHAEAGGGPVLAGDDLVGRSAGAVAEVVDRSRRDRSRPLRPDEQVVATDGTTPAAVAEAVRAALTPH